jgi:hypothetical protein
MLVCLLTAASFHFEFVRFLGHVHHLHRPVLIDRFAVTFGLLERVNRLVFADQFKGPERTGRIESISYVLLST